jgi:ABC-2 type transport system ATP-binding protein
VGFCFYLGILVKMKSILSVKNLRKSYDNREVVKGISFEVKQGEIFGILGPNGAGKTTTLEMIETMRPIESGDVVLDGIDVARRPEDIKHRIGVQLQSSAFMDRLTLVELLELFAATYGISVDARQLLEEVQLSDKAKSNYRTLSGGQQQRFSIASALVNKPKVLFLDEPTTGLDPQARRNLWELIKSIKQKGVTVILTTHYMEEAAVLCERVAIMDNGVIVALDSPQRLVKQLLARGFTKAQHVEQADLEDVFIDLTGKELRE